MNCLDKNKSIYMNKIDSIKMELRSLTKFTDNMKVICKYVIYTNYIHIVTTF